MSHSCVIGRRCGANGLGWLVGRHPSVSEGCARRRVCFASFSGWYFRSSCCRWSTFISVRNCGTFFVYKLRRPPTCNLRYCGDGIPPISRGKRLCCLNYFYVQTERSRKGKNVDKQQTFLSQCLLISTIPQDGFTKEYFYYLTLGFYNCSNFDRVFPSANLEPSLTRSPRMKSLDCYFILNR